MDLTAVIKKGEKQYVALCPEVDVVSQGHTIEESIKNLKEAVELYIEEMGLPEGAGTQEMLVTSFEVDAGAKTASSVRA
ncbi:MAG: type II toxin-antitoxin system HicB family antitoxin [Nanoarchaeota archaeon]|nr:type II toxin-antitoxin system HicB family antitoxin [Nanoarchaeota archaeon]MBU1135040.1 type II toxin-antitoxin system HicB family antitoxin [Nanoarchaeota archaeon]MBU2520326.1 type II toxin-antitoxin system HicB family antitoxin [Nanoarchaeota archaeon]